MKNFYIITNKLKDPLLETTTFIYHWLMKNGAKCCIAPMDEGEKSQQNKKEQFLLNSEESGGFEKKIPKDAYQTIEQTENQIECIIVLGGDGTLLQAARDTIGRNIPLIVVNLGSLGFLAEVEKNNLVEALYNLLEDNFETEQRMMLDATVSHEDDTSYHMYPALNDITITRSGSLRIVRFDIYVNDLFLCRWSADGIIIATPTGSTGYNMSAGGPIVEPGADLIVVTPVCAHTLNARSIILRADDRIKISIADTKTGGVLLVEANSDGYDRVPMVTGESIQIKKTEQTTTIIKLSKESFVEVLHRKMSE